MRPRRVAFGEVVVVLRSPLPLSTSSMKRFIIIAGPRPRTTVACSEVIATKRPRAPFVPPLLRPRTRFQRVCCKRFQSSSNSARINRIALFAGR